jgi:hypothetical protein
MSNGHSRGRLTTFLSARIMDSSRALTILSKARKPSAPATTPLWIWSLQEQTALPLPDVASAPTRRVALRRIVLGAVLLGVFAAGLGFSFFALFSRFRFYDDEGKMLLFTQHLLNGDALYDQINFLYGPSYLFDRWLLFSWLGFPLSNDAARTVTLLTWGLTALLLATTAWRLAGGTVFALGLGAVVWIATILQLFVLTNEPGHPQELVVLLLAAAFWLPAQLWAKRPGATLMLLGAITGSLILTKINVGVLFGLGLGFSLVSLGPRPSPVWMLLRVASGLAILALPTVLMRSRLFDGYGTFCFMITSALFPCCLLALLRVKPGEVTLRHLLLCGAGAAAATGLMVGFALTKGNTPAGMVRALLVQPFHTFAVVKYGWALALPRFTAAWAFLGAGLGVWAVWAGPRRWQDLRPLRVFFCVIVFADAIITRSGDSRGAWLAMPLIWLVLVPPAGFARQSTEWFLRLLFAFTTCLQPIQIFPFPGSQIHIGTLSTVLVAAVVLVDLYHEIRIAERLALPPAIIVRVALTLVLAVLTVLIVSWRLAEGFDRWAPLPNPATVATLFGTGMGFIAVWVWPRVRGILGPLKLLTCAIIFGSVLISRWDTSWMRFALPLIWLVLAPPAVDGWAPKELVFRLCLTLTCCLAPLRLLPLADGPFHLETLAMLAAGVVLLGDVLPADLMGRHRFRARALDWNVLVSSFALLVGGQVAFDAAGIYQRSVPLELRGCRWTRLPEKDAALLSFVTANVEASSDSFVARIGLMSLNFWANQRPVGNFVFGNEWESLDPATNELLLSTYGSHLRMMFIDNPRPWYLESHGLEFSKFAAAQPVPTFLEFVGSHFKLLARVGNCRLLVRKERTDLDLFDCAYEAGRDPNDRAKSRLRLKLPENRGLNGIATIELLDLDSDETVASTEPSVADLRLVLDDGRKTLVNAGQVSPTATRASHERMFLTYPTAIRLDRIPFPALRFLDQRGRRLLTLPVAVETNLAPR